MHEGAWSVLRSAIIILVMSLLISSGLIAGSYYYVDEMHAGYKKHHQRYLTASRNFLSIDEEEQLINAYYPRYKSLLAQGIIGDERRLNWIDGLKSAGLSIRLPSLRYQIASREDYDEPLLEKTGGFYVYASRMKLDLGLLHEGDLNMLFNELGRRSPGLFTVEQCSITSSSQQLIMKPDQTNLKAICDLQWMTINPT